MPFFRITRRFLSLILFMIQTIEDEVDRQRLTKIYLEHQKLFECKASQAAHNATDAEDLLQNAMLKVIKKISALQELTDAQLVCYIVKTIQNCAIDENRRKEIRSKYEGINLTGEWTAESNEEFANRLEKEDLSIQLGMALEMLPPKEKDVILYKYFFDYSDDQIAALLDIQTSSVRMTLTRARRTLKELLEREDYCEIKHA